MPSLNSTLPANVARSNFYQILDEADDKLRQFTITLRGKAKAVVMSAAEFDGWLETLDIMSNPKLVAEIKLGAKELKAGKGISANQVDKILKW